MKAIVLLSGGLDSTTILAMAVKKYGAENVTALSIYYGQRHDKEIQASNKIVSYYKVAHQVLDLKEIFTKSNCSLLKQSSVQVPLGSYEELSKKENIISTYVPFRNGLFLSVAASIALSLGASILYYGIHKDDQASSAYPDTSVAFNRAISRAIYLGSGKQLKVVAPFANKNKAAIVKKGMQLKVPYEMTWSCYEGHDKACGQCPTCIDREIAFLQNGIQDPVPYEKRMTKEEFEHATKKECF